VAVSDRPDGDPVRLPRDPRNPDPTRYDYFALHRRMVDLAGQRIRVAVEREGESQPVTISVPPAFARDLGLVMKMEQVVAVRHGSPAEAAQVRKKGPAGEPGDVIDAVEVAKPGGGTLRFTRSPAPQPADGVEERLLNPVRLPRDLAQWAAGWPEGSAKKVTLTVLRSAGHVEREQRKLTLDWDDSWRYALETPISPQSPLSIPALGLAYRVETVIVEVTPDSAAAKAGLRRDDEVKAVRFYADGGKDTEKVSLKRDQWAWAFSLYQDVSTPTRIDLTVQQAGSGEQVTVELSNLPEDTSWPVVNRGFRFDTDVRALTADSPMAAIALGFDEVGETAKNVYLSLKSMVEGGISFWLNANGPIAIAATAYNVAGESMVKFVLLLSILSVNLAVLNFLPIPVLDGGHMVFLTYEWARGRPAPEFVRTAATFAGMALLLSLMACVIVLDVMKYFIKS
jgi:regulator of sigma E protease